MDAQNIKRVLVVEDEKPLAMALELFLKSTGAEVVVAYDGQEGIEKLLQNPVDVVLLDLIMPNVDGFGFLEQLQSHPTKPKVIVTSNLNQKSDIDRVKALGAVDFIVKANTSLEDIVKRVQTI